MEHLFNHPVTIACQYLISVKIPSGITEEHKMRSNLNKKSFESPLPVLYQGGLFVAGLMIVVALLSQI